MTFLRRRWQGKYSLPVTFWGFYCAGLVACLVLAGAIVALGWSLDARPIARATALALLYSYLLIATVGVWRSAGAYWASPIWMSRIWAAAARLFVIAWIGTIAFRLANGGALAVVQWIRGEVLVDPTARPAEACPTGCWRTRSGGRRERQRAIAAATASRTSG